MKNKTPVLTLILDLNLCFELSTDPKKHAKKIILQIIRSGSGSTKRVGQTLFNIYKHHDIAVLENKVRASLETVLSKVKTMNPPDPVVFSTGTLQVEAISKPTSAQFFKDLKVGDLVIMSKDLANTRIQGAIDVYVHNVITGDYIYITENLLYNRIIDRFTFSVVEAPYDRTR